MSTRSEISQGLESPRVNCQGDMGRQKRYPWLRGKASNGSTTDYQANSKVTRRGPPEALPQAPYGETERHRSSNDRPSRRSSNPRTERPQVTSADKGLKASLPAREVLSFTRELRGEPRLSQ